MKCDNLSFLRGGLAFPNGQVGESVEIVQRFEGFTVACSA